MLKTDFIERAQSKWDSPILFVRKKDESNHFCVKYGTLDALTIRDSYLIPPMDKYFDWLGEPSPFSTLEGDSKK